MHDFMDIALELAAKEQGFTAPNPVVGAVVVKDGKIIAAGRHKQAGKPHAEVIALQKAGSEAQAAELYVTLEPCSHYGKTPPCTDLIIKSGIKKVISAMEDPNPLVKGKGHQKLIDNGIEVITNVRKKEAERLNEIFIKNITQNQPYIILKAAISLDGKIASSSGDSKWISNTSSRQKVHQIRNSVDAVLVGKNTFLIDDPRLNIRLKGRTSDPQKVILTDDLNSVLEKIESSKMYQLPTLKSILICVPNSKSDSAKIPADLKNVKIVPFTNLKNLPDELFKMGIGSILLEGGSGVYSSFYKAELIDKIVIFQSTKIIGKDGLSWMGNLGLDKIESAKNLKDVKFEQFDDNMMIEGYL